MTPPRRLLLALGLILAFHPSKPTRADLDEYVKRPDASFAWKVEKTRSTPGLEAAQIALTSQTWRGAAWTHQLQVYSPDTDRSPDVMLLFITGGSTNGDQPLFRGAGEGLALAKACGARVAVLPQVPNQPLLGDRYEDDLIAETFVKYLETGDEDWPLLQPMVKSAVRAMDAIQQWAKAEGKPVPSKFVVTGASKRGWTTWLTGAVDPRVVAIAPMVIPTLNMREQNKHQIETWGKYSEQIEDYTRRGLMDKLDTPRGTTLWKLIDPFTYRERLTLPKLQINGTNDPYWTLDSLNLYWNDLKGPSNVVYLPNAVHNLQEHRDWAINAIGALFRTTVSGKTLPEIALTTAPDDDGNLQLRASSSTPPREARLWVANSDDKDFRGSKWEISGKGDPRIRQGADALSPILLRPAKGSVAAFCDFIYDVDGLEYHLSSPIAILGPKSQGK